MRVTRHIEYDGDEERVKQVLLKSLEIGEHDFSTSKGKLVITILESTNAEDCEAESKGSIRACE